MKTIYSILVILTFLSINLNAQTPTLVSDFNEGPEDSFVGSFSGKYIGNDIIIPIVSNTLGKEIAIISNGELSILKDIYPGIGGSDPSGFTLFKGEVYFSARESGNTFSIWKTDGTSEGTQMVFTPGTSENVKPRSFIVAKNGWMYFSYEEKIFRTDGSNHEEIFEGAALDFDFSNASYTYCTYKNGIAFIKKNNDKSFSIYAIEDNLAVELAKTESTGFFADGFGIAPVKDGLMFSLNDSDIDGIYVYNENDQSLNSLPIDNELIPSRRTINLNDDKNISWIANKGYYLVNGKQYQEKLIFATSNSSATQGKNILFSKYNNKALFVVTEGTFGDDYLMITDGTVSGTENLTELQSYQSNIATYNQNSYIADGTSNGFNPNLYQVNLESGDLKLVYTFAESSNNSKSIRPVGVQNNKLYFLSNLDSEVGLELYSIDLNNQTNIKDLNSDINFRLLQSGNSLEIEMEETVNLKIAIYNPSGAMLLNKDIKSNQSFELDVPSGMYFLHVVQNNKHTSVPFQIIRN